jgi:phosphoribosylformylglycinamidine synthase I
MPKVLILRAPGTNCDGETAFAFEAAGAETERVHICRLLEQPSIAADYQILCLPGGFSYGDDVAAGRILANQIEHHLADVLGKFKDDGKLILGICNGFQVLIKSGLLLEADSQHGQTATLTWNDSGKFEDRWVELSTASEKCVFLKGIDRMYLPIAHAEGKFVARDADTLANLDRDGQLVLRYRPLDGSESNGQPVPYPDNPNGSTLNVAGLTDSTGRVFGLMPHPERFIDSTQHPRWTRESLPPEGDGLAVFKNAVGYFA